MKIRSLATLLLLLAASAPAAEPSKKSKTSAEASSTVTVVSPGLHAASGSYQSKEELSDWETAESGKAKVHELKVVPLDSGDDPLFQRVRVEFTFFSVSHKTFMPTFGAGVGSVNDAGQVKFKFVDDQGRKGEGTITGNLKKGNLEVTLKTKDLSEGQTLSDQYQQIYNKAHPITKSR